MFEREDAKKLSKVGIHSLLDLALFLPSAYEDNSLSQEFIDGQTGVYSIKIESASRGRGRVYRAKGYESSKDQEVDILFFNALPYHRATIKSGFEGYLKGRVQKSGRHITLLQPKILKEVGGIDFKYQTKLLKKKSIVDIKNRYLSLEALKEAGLPEEVASEIINLHFPKSIIPTNPYPPSSLEALKFTEIYHYLKRLSSKRRVFEAKVALKSPTDEFIKQLPFSLTSEQKSVLQDIESDLEQKEATRRVVVGDVGSGKSVLMFIAAFKAKPYKSIIMAPTTVLANQLHSEALRLSEGLLKVALFTQSKKEPFKEADLIIGTHALLYTDLPESVLIMVDEQHRFGTNQRAKLMELLREDRLRPHYLQFSATPIPRTKAMINSTLINYSFITKTPFEKNITTAVIRNSDFKNVLSHIRQETQEGRQVAIIYPLVEESENFEYMSIAQGASFWESRFEGVYKTHGKDREKEQVLEEFAKKGSILISTTVIEVGISLPRLSTILIVGAERLGLAQLHQLRGRVGRIGLKSYCFLYTKQKTSPRLDMFAKTTSGFEIAELDLKFRESGDLLEGRRQSGKRFRFFDYKEDVIILQKVKEILG
ncbi:MAG: ATP-dependent DNA helicase RecG [Campylobacterales bacterium]